MYKLLLLPFLLLSLLCCRNSASRYQSYEPYYEYRIDSLAETHAIETEDGTRLVDLAPGTIVIVRGTPGGGWSYIDYNGYRLRVYDPVWTAIRPVNYTPPPKYRSAKDLPVYAYYTTGPNPVRVPAARRASEIRSLRGEYESTSTSRNGYTPSTGAEIHTGPRGGRFYINSNGNKTYIKRSSPYHSSGSSYRSRSSSRSYRSSVRRR